MGTRTRAVGLAEVVESDGVSALLQEMRQAAGLTVREVAERMHVSEGAVHQYLYRRRGLRGTSSLRWFLKYAEACGCGIA
jgi:transcriptional regulator with XRE-family HTH domain